MTTGHAAPKRLSVLFAGGGTGGHLYPAIAIAEEIRQRRPDAEITFVGTDNSIEARVVPTQGFRFASIWISGFKRKMSLDMPLFFVKLVVACGQSLVLIRKLRPDVVVGTGGYVCGPPLYVASLLGLPTLIQEQNSFPGVTTRMLASRMNEVHISFETAKRQMKRLDNVFVTGNPTRAAIGTIQRAEGARFFGIDPLKKTLVVVGGSQGAASINNAMLGILREIQAMHVQLVWVTGSDDFARIEGAVQETGLGEAAGVKLFQYLETMENVYAVADLAVCRSGATTIAELTRAGVPSVLIPYPFAAADHQTENAKAVAESGAAVVVRDREMGETLLRTIRDLLGDPQRLESMAAKARAQGAPQATETLATAALRLAGA